MQQIEGHTLLVTKRMKYSRFLNSSECEALMQVCKTIVNRWMVPCVFVVILCLSAAGSVHSSDFDGQWTGTWKSAFGDTGATYGSLFLSGGSISRTLTSTHTDCGTVAFKGHDGTVLETQAVDYGNGKVDLSLSDAIVIIQLLSGMTPEKDFNKAVCVEDNPKIGLSEAICTLQITSGLKTPDIHLGENFVNSIDMTFKHIPAGSYMMGSPENEQGRSDGEIQHQVALTKPFFLQTTEVTQGQWKAVMGSNPSYFSACGDDCPVENVSWDDVQGFISELNKLEQGTYRLPTEAEWEYAARAGTTTPFHTGDCLSTDEANYNGNYPLEGCQAGIDRRKTLPVSSFPPNAWGLYDMHGNVAEWVADIYGEYLSTDVIDPTGARSGYYQILRGGSWYSGAGGCRSASRESRKCRDQYGNMTDYGERYNGFRLVWNGNMKIEGEDIDETMPYRSVEIISRDFILENTGDSQIEWSAGVNGSDVISLSTASGSIEKGQVEKVTVYIEADQLPIGIYENNIQFSYSCGDIIKTDSFDIRISVYGWTAENSVGMEFNLIPAGRFMMGSPEGELGRNDDETLHKVTLSKAFYMQTTEVTQGQWKAIMGEDSNPSFFSECGDDCPVENVTWDSLQEFITALNKLGEGIYRLPTEAEWEYAARAGTLTAFANGDIIETMEGYDPNLDEMGWYYGNSLGYTAYPRIGFVTQPVAGKKPNDWGLYDMHGNVAEIVQDWYGEYPSEDITDPVGPLFGSGRVYRGGDTYARNCRSAYRYGFSPNMISKYRGFRLVREGDLFVQGEDIIETLSYGYNEKVNRQFTIKNIGMSNLTWEIDFPLDEVISVTPASGELEPDETATITLSVDTAKISKGTYINNIRFNYRYNGLSQEQYSAAVQRRVKIDIVSFVNNLDMGFNLIPAGNFMMGSPEDEPERAADEIHRHVTLTTDYYIQTTEVTQGQWNVVMGEENNPSYFSGCGEDCPVENLTWDNIQGFITELNKLGQGTYRLPTEAEWEYAARAGTTTAFNTGDTISKNQANYFPLEWQGDGFARIEWYLANGSTLPVASFPPNPWGLYDTHGNVGEVVQDYIVKGGSWFDSLAKCRSASRRSGSSHSVLRDGFRLVRVPDLNVQGSGIVQEVLLSSGKVLSRQYILKNNGSGTLDWIVDFTEGDAIDVTPLSGTLESDQTVTVDLTIDTGKLSETTYENVIRFVNISEKEPVSVKYPVTLNMVTIADLGMDFIHIPEGRFLMGSPENEPERSTDETIHEVTLTGDYYMQATEVTQRQWNVVMGTNPSYFSACGQDCPVENVSWNDVQAFIAELNKLGQDTYRLPTEAEWEYAARAGTTTPFNTGDCLSTDEANYKGTSPLTGCPEGAYRRNPLPVSGFEPNDWGLYDMHGNVSEWVQDWYGRRYYTPEGITDPKGPATGSYRVVRGGSYYDSGAGSRSACRKRSSPTTGSRYTGFRLVKE